ncbi:MAG: acetyl-CoA carboxylase biotin carboxyl carrier protein subunit [Thermoanaerobaculia bacterium]
MKLSCGQKTQDVRTEKGEAWLNERRVELAFQAGGDGALELWLGGRRHRAVFAHDGKRLLLWCDGRCFVFERAAAGTRAAQLAGGLIAPMPGRVRKTLVAQGERVEKGQVVLILEAMKMEHAILAPESGQVVRLTHREGDLVDAGTELAVIA